MSLKFEIETWVAALDAYKKQDYELAVDLFGRVEPSSKMLVNIALIYAALGEHELAVENFRTATSLDPYLAVAYFQAGVSNFILGKFEEAYNDFEDAFDHLRGNQAINYEQLGLKFILFSAEVVFNKGLSLMRMGRQEEGMQMMMDSRGEKVTPEHDVIDEAIEEGGEGYTVFSISLGVLYEPSAVKVRNAKARDWLGKAKLITSPEDREAQSPPKQRSQSETNIPPVPPKSTSPPPGDSGLNRSRSATVAGKVSDIEFTAPRPLARNATTGAPRVTFAGQQPSNPRTQPATQLPLPGNSGAPGLTSRPSLRVDIQSRNRANVSRSPSNSSKSLSSVNADDEDDTGVRIVNSAGSNGARGAAQIYDGVLDTYSPVKASPPPAIPLPPLPNGPPPRVLVSKNERYTPSDMESVSTVGPRRRPTLKSAKNGVSRASAAVSRYDEVSADWNGEEYGAYGREPSFTRIRVKLFYDDDVRGMAIPPSMPFEDFMERVCAKFNVQFGQLSMKFEDDEGTKVSLRDSSDYDMAIETARETAKNGSEGKLSIWCQSV